MRINRQSWLEHGGLPVIASISGGKDSGAMALALMEADIPFRAVFLDSGWEWSGTYEYLRGPLTKAIGPIVEISGPLKMAELCAKKGMFPSRVRRFCTQDLKVLPMAKFLRGLGEDVVNAVGVRHEESPKRAKMPEWEYQEGFDAEVWRPIIDWTQQDVVNIHARHGLRPNPLYIAGLSRVGCWPCIMATKADLRAIAILDPGRISVLRALEVEVGNAARERRMARGEPMDGWTPPTWFQARTDDRRIVGGERMRGTGLFPCWPIDRVIEWATTASGRGASHRPGVEQVELFGADPWARGCARWGLCEDHSP
jgi:3'-phosphoadenosine 5'-phosphosulfate sulfotransferase (PAPS reductase)/FAD synthetase